MAKKDRMDKGKPYKKNISVLFLYTALSILIKSGLLVFIKSDYFFRLDFSILALLMCLRYLPPILLVSGFSLCFYGKIQQWSFILTGFFVSFLLMVDDLFIRAFGKLPSIVDLSTAMYTPDLGSSVWAMIRLYDVIWFVDLPILILVVTKFNIREHSRRVFVYIFILVVSVATMLSYMLKPGEICDQRHLLELMSPIGYHMYDVASQLLNTQKTLSNHEYSILEDYFHEHSKRIDNTADGEYYALFKGKDLIIVQFESLENIVIGEKYNGVEVTPTLNKLTHNAIYFNNVHEQVSSGNSADAEFILNTSIYPLRKGSAFVQYPLNTYRTLPSLFQEEEYYTMAIHGDDKDFWNRNVAYAGLGYDEFISEEEFSELEPFGLGQSDRVLFKEALLRIEQIKEANNNYLQFIITTTSHMPFELPEIENDFEFGDENVIANYYQSLHYADKQLGNFVEELKARGLLNNVVIVIYGDHEGVHKYYPTEIEGMIASNDYKTPLIVYCPSEIDSEIRIETVGGQIDIYPTLTHLWGIESEKYSQYVMGESLFEKENHVLLASDDTLGQESNDELFYSSYEIANLVIQSNYFSNVLKDELIDHQEVAIDME